MVRQVRGIIGVTNSIVVTPPLTAARVEVEIEQAFQAGGRGGRATSGFRYPITPPGSTDTCTH